MSQRMIQSAQIKSDRGQATGVCLSVLLLIHTVLLHFHYSYPAETLKHSCDGSEFRPFCVAGSLGFASPKMTVLGKKQIH